MSQLLTDRSGVLPRGRGVRIADGVLLADLVRVATELRRRAISQSDYAERGRYSFITVCRRFGSWKAALLRVKLRPAHFMNISADLLLGDILRVARELGTSRLRYREYAARGKYSRKIVYRHFGRWQRAMEEAGLVPVITRPGSNRELFENLKEVGRKLGRQPRWAEMKGPVSKFGASAYTSRFGTFRKALAAFERAVETDEATFGGEERRNRGPRTVNLRLRFEILRRDHFRCVSCGRSPATDPRVQLQVDHIKPWSNGGLTVAENLQTLCQMCNRGKSDLPMA